MSSCKKVSKEIYTGPPWDRAPSKPAPVPQTRKERRLAEIDALRSAAAEAKPLKKDSIGSKGSKRK